MGMECEAAYQEEEVKSGLMIWQGIQQKLKEQTITYERIFKENLYLTHMKQ
jgi:hypothetical protein